MEPTSAEKAINGSSGDQLTPQRGEREGSRSEHPKLSRDTILNQAAELFKRNGYRKTRLEELAQILGVTRPAIYYHFAAKQDLLVAIELRSIQRLQEAADAVDREDLPPTEMFWRHIEAHIIYVASHPVEAGIVFEEEEELPEEIKVRLLEMRRDYTKRLVDLYTEAVISGDAPSGDPRLAVNTILGAATWVYRWSRDSIWGDPRIAAKEMVRILRADPGIETKPRRRSKPKKAKGKSKS
jgi:AcrR family transcriptional regulator